MYAPAVLAPVSPPPSVIRLYLLLTPDIKMHAKGLHTASSPWNRLLVRLFSSLKLMLTRPMNTITYDTDLSKDPKRLAQICRPICADMLRQLQYPGAPQLKGESVEALLEYMHRRAVEMGVPLNTPISAKGFRLGYAEGLVSFLLSTPHRKKGG